MRIIGGQFRGRKLFAPKGLQIRPTADRVREAIFNILGDRVRGARVADLFAGTGAMGLEALSRGAARAVFVDAHPAALASIRRNLETMGLAEPLVLRADLSRGLGPLEANGPFDLIFMDPPYARDVLPLVLSRLKQSGLAAAGGVAVLEHGGGLSQIEATGWQLLDERRYGRARVCFLALEEDSPA
jgi:16S rRNA (guanine966-N2)-methyltransferase